MEPLWSFNTNFFSFLSCFIFCVFYALSAQSHPLVVFWKSSKNIKCVWCFSGFIFPGKSHHSHKLHSQSHWVPFSSSLSGIPAWGPPGFPLFVCALFESSLLWPSSNQDFLFLGLHLRFGAPHFPKSSKGRGKRGKVFVVVCLKIYLFIFIHVYMPLGRYPCAYSQITEQDFRSLEAQVEAVLSHCCGYWELNSDSPEVQHKLLTSDSPRGKVLRLVSFSNILTCLLELAWMKLYWIFLSNLKYLWITNFFISNEDWVRWRIEET